MFVPQTPGSSPYVTAVGGTTGAETEVCRSLQRNIVILSASVGLQ